MTVRVGPVLQSFFVDHLRSLKGVRPSTVRSYRDALRLFVVFVACDRRSSITGLSLEDLSFECVQRFLRHLEEVRGNHVRTRNQRLAALHTFFEYVAGRFPEFIAVAERVAAIPEKRAPLPETRFLERDEVKLLLAHLAGRHAERDRVLLLFLYNTGARVQEVVDLRVEHLDLDGPFRVRLHGKGGKWRICPLWPETVRRLQDLLLHRVDGAVFESSRGRPLTRFGIYKIVRRRTEQLELGLHDRRISPHVFRHTAAVHLLESGVEVNVIRAWLGHVSLDTTNRYAEITTPMKEAAVRACAPPDTSEASPRKPVWRNDESLLAWLRSL